MDRKIEKKRFTLRNIAIYGGLLVLAGFFFSAIYREAGTDRLNVQEDRLLVDTIETGVFKEYITLFGTVEPIKTVFLDAVETGKIEDIFAEDGSMVVEGQQIIRLSNLDLQLNVLNQEAQIITQINTIRNTSILMEQQSLALKEEALDVAYRLDQLEKQAKRNSELYSEKVIAQVEFEETQDEYEHLQRREKLLKATLEKDSLFNKMQQNQMETSLDLMKRNLAVATTSLENLTVKAPISGQLSSLDAEVGELISRGDKIAQIDVLDDYKIRARIDEFYISRIFPQQAGSLLVNKQTYPLKIKKIYPEVANGTFEADLVFTGERPKNIKRGQSLSIKLSLSDETKALLLAKGGFYQETGGNWVYVINPKTGIARKKAINIGRQNPNYYEVLGGLEDGDIVIVSSYDYFGDKEELVLQ